MKDKWATLRFKMAVFLFH